MKGMAPAMVANTVNGIGKRKGGKERGKKGERERREGERGGEGRGEEGRGGKGRGGKGGREGEEGRDSKTFLMRSLLTSRYSILFLWPGN